MAEFRRFECDRCNKRVPEDEKLTAVTVAIKSPLLKVPNANTNHAMFMTDGIWGTMDKYYDLCEACAKGVTTALEPKKGLFG